MRRILSAIFLVVAHLALNARAEVRLPSFFSNHMVLQQERPIILWGWGKPNGTIIIQLAAVSQEVKANDRGEWKATLPPMKAAGPLILTVTGAGDNELQFDDVMIGEVWLCSGQSNMEMGIQLVRNAKKEIAEANYPGIRLLKVTKSWLPQPQNNIEVKGSSEGVWKVCSPKTIAQAGWGGFSAVAYFFGRELHQKLGVTIGLIDSTWGGTRIESWTPPEGFAEVSALQQEYEKLQLGDPHGRFHQQHLQKAIDDTEKWIESVRQSLTNQTPVPMMPAFPDELYPPHELQQATALYNGMIHPLHPFAVRGVIWYQGESNCMEGMLYAERMKALIYGWRKLWGQTDFPFYFVQLAPFNHGGDPVKFGEMLEAQATAARIIPDTAMTVINDIGDVKDVHPTNKQEVGRRLSLLALAKTYGRTNLAISGPVFKAMTIEEGKLRLTFDFGEGLASRDGKPLSWFEIMDADGGGFVKADAQIDGATVLVSSPTVKHPVAMRFGWSMLAEPNLMNGAGLPAGAFRAGDVPERKVK